MMLKMSGDFAGAMVTVIPLVMLMCAAEAKALYAYWDSKADNLATEANAARAAAGSDPLWAQRWMLRNPEKLLPWIKTVMGTVYWFGMAAAHFLSEAGLILWLASARPPGIEHLAELVTVTAIWGFGHATLVGVFVVMVQVPRRLSQAARDAYRTSVVPASTESP